MRNHGNGRVVRGLENGRQDEPQAGWSGGIVLTGMQPNGVPHGGAYS